MVSAILPSERWRGGPGAGASIGGLPRVGGELGAAAMDDGPSVAVGTGTITAGPVAAVAVGSPAAGGKVLGGDGAGQDHTGIEMLEAVGSLAAVRLVAVAVEVAVGAGRGAARQPARAGLGGGTAGSEPQAGSPGD